MEKRGVYSAHICTENFAGLARAVAAGRGSPDHPIFVLPADAELPEAWSEDHVIRKYATVVLDELLAGVTR